MTWWFYWLSLALVATVTAFVSYWTGVSTGERSKRATAAPDNAWNNVRVVPDDAPLGKFADKLKDVGNAMDESYSKE